MRRLGKILFLIMVVLAVYGCSTQQASTHDENVKENTMNKKLKSKKTMVQEVLSIGLIQPDKAMIEDFIVENYIQHNPMAEDGRAGLLKFIDYLASLPEKPQLTVIRLLEDGEFVAAHSELILGGEKHAVMDLFRFENHKIVEHWDGIQKEPTESANGNTMLDGATEIVDYDKTESNKVFIKNYIETLLIKKEFDKLSSFFNGDNYIQHNPMIPNGVSGLSKAFMDMQKQGITVEFTKIHRVIGEGNFVLVQSEGLFNKKPTAFYDLLRVENGKVAEHWDVIQEIPDSMPHSNGMF